LDESARLQQRCRALSINPTKRRWIVSIGSQSMALVEDGRVARRFDVSTSAKPPSCEEDSNGTPLGLHAAADKIGDGEPLGMVFEGRRPTRLVSEYSDEERRANLIATRIVRLRGLEPGVNAGPGCDSYDRYIYFHGTNHEDRIGRPFSGGCIELRNRAMVAFFDLIEEGDVVWLTEGHRL